MAIQFPAKNTQKCAEFICKKYKENLQKSECTHFHQKSAKKSLKNIENCQTIFCKFFYKKTLKMRQISCKLKGFFSLKMKP